VTHVAFLRAVNVGGQGLVKMSDLQAAFAAAGCRNVRTVIASGNVIFDAPAGLPATRERIVEKVGALLKADPVIVFRTLNYLQQLVAAAPFGERVDDPTVKLYVVFLEATPRRVPAFPLAVAKEFLDVIGMHKQDALVVSRRKPNGFYGFPGEWPQKEMGVAATARNWSTVRRIVDHGSKAL
jgi:uncharacterized protein (DUF1697 family)